MAPKVRKGETIAPTRRSLRIREKKMKSIDDSGNEEKSLPKELTLEIFSWLPLEPLVRFKCLSKWWRAAIQDHSFVQKHSERLGLCYLCPKVTDDQMDGEKFYPSHANYGLVLERSYPESNYRIRNPYTKQVLVIPYPMEQFQNILMIYSQTDNKYKLFYLYKKEGTTSDGCKVLTLETDQTWRDLNVPEFNGHYTRKLINGVYFILKEDHQIVWIDIKNENSSTVNNVPRDFITSPGHVTVTSWNKMVAIARMDHNSTGDWRLNVWILEDYEKQRWADRKISWTLDFVKKYFPQATTLTFLTVMGSYLALSVDSEKHYIRYNIMDPKEDIIIKDTPSDLNIRSLFTPSVAFLQGMTAEDADRSAYEIVPV